MAVARDRPASINVPTRERMTCRVRKAATPEKSGSDLDFPYDIAP